MAEYAVWISTPFGARLGVVPLERVTSLTYTLVTNGVGSLVIEMEDDAIDPAWLRPDARIEVRRKPDGGTWGLEGRTMWLVQTMTRGLSQEGRYRKLTALAATTLLERRSTLYYSGSAAVTVSSQAADDAMKAVVRSNLGSTANLSPAVVSGGIPSRTWAPSVVVDDNASLGPAISKELAWRNVLSVLQDIAADAATLGTPVYFALVWTGGALVFRTWVGQTGLDRTGALGRFIVSPEHGTLGGTVEVTEDWSDTATAVVAGGQGQAGARALGYAADATTAARSQYGLRELFVNATSMTASASLAAEARAELHRRRPKRTLSGQILSAPGALYGVDWGHGDRLLAQFDGEAFSSLVETVTVKLTGGNESIDAKIVGAAA